MNEKKSCETCKFEKIIAQIQPMAKECKNCDENCSNWQPKEKRNEIL